MNFGLVIQGLSKNNDFWMFSFKLKLHRTLQRHYSYSVIGNIKISWVEKLKFLLRHFARVENSFHLFLFSESTFALIQTCKLTFWKKESQKLELAYQEHWIAKKMAINLPEEISSFSEEWVPQSLPKR